MRAILYVHLIGNKNRLKRSLRKAGTWLWVAVMGLYAFLVLPSLGGAIEKGGIGRPEYFVLILTAFSLYMSPINYAAYARRKGLLFFPCDVQLMFPAPISPKLLLIHASIRTNVMNVVMSLLLYLAGVIWFRVPAGAMALYCIFNIFISALMETCLVICLYGNERFSEKANRRFGRLMYLLIGCLFLPVVAMVISKELSWQAMLEFLSGDWVQLIPILGWEIGVMRLIILGPDAVNLTAALLFFLCLTIFFCLALRLRCTGAYYEDAMKFADDYQEAREKAKKGQTAVKKKNLRQASVAYRGGGARAVFYRQYLEIRKSRWYIFGGQTLAAVVLAALLTWSISSGKNTAAVLESMESLRYYVIPLALLYFALIFSGQQNRWGKERENPYIFLIPDTAFKKLWYATLMTHVSNGIHGLILIAPLCWALRLPPWMILLYAPFYVAMAAVWLYADVICETYLSSSIPAVGRRILRMLLSFTAVFTALPAMIAAEFFAGPVAGVAAGFVFLCGMTAILLLAGAHSFSRMEMGG